MKEGLAKPEGPSMMGIEEAWAHMVLTDKTVDNYKKDRMMQIKHKAVHYPGQQICYSLPFCFVFALIARGSTQQGQSFDEIAFGILALQDLLY